MRTLPPSASRAASWRSASWGTQIRWLCAPGRPDLPAPLRCGSSGAGDLMRVSGWIWLPSPGRGLRARRRGMGTRGLAPGAGTKREPRRCRDRLRGAPARAPAACAGTCSGRRRDRRPAQRSAALGCRWQPFGPAAWRKPPGYFSFPAWTGPGHAARTRPAAQRGACATRFSRWHTAGAPRAGRPGSSPPSSRLAIRPGQAPCPGRCRGTAACPGREPLGR